MKKFVIIFFAATMAITSCTNKDNENNASTIARNSKEAPVVTTLCHFWKHPKAYYDCVEAKVSDSLCYITMGCDGKEAVQALADIDPNDHHIKYITIPNYTSLSGGLSLYYQKYISLGHIKFEYDCPIYDTNILSKVSIPYIPAGTYNITKSGNNAVIAL